MSDAFWMRLWFGAEDMWFCCMVAMDFLLIASIVFSIPYSAYLLLCRCFPRRALFVRHVGATLLLALAAIPLSLSAVGDAVAVLTQMAVHSVLLFPGEGVTPNIPVLIWLAGAAIACVRLAREFLGIRGWVRTCPTIPDTPVFVRAKKELGMGKTVVLKQSAPGVPAAASWGLFRKCVFVPDGFESAYSEEERYCIFLHELAHVRRRDTAKYLCARLAGAVFWFHPLVRLAVRNIRDAIEIACDAATVGRTGVDPLRYARLIVKAHANESAPMPAFSSDYNDIKRRLGHIMGDTRLAAGLPRRLLLPGVFLLVFTGAVLFLLEPAQRLVRDSGQPMETPMIIDGPNGEKLELTTWFRWIGALGSYAVTDARRVDADAE